MYTLSGPKRSIRRTLIIGSILFVIALCILLSLLTNRLFSAALYDRYQDQLENILTYVEHNIDADDLEECLKTGEPSETYQREQEFLNGMVDDLGLSYLYIVIPEQDLMYNAISATSAEEFAAGETNMAIMEVSDAYTAEELARYRSYWDTEGVSFFEENSDWGFFYTGVLPLRDARGETVALACADIPIADLHARIQNYLVANSLLIVGICVMFGALLLAWMRRSVTAPILDLERSARSFAQLSHSVEDFRDLRYEAPEIRSENEVRSLSEAISTMSEDIRRYMEEILAAQNRIVAAEREAETMSVVAYRDALTHVKSKAAYDEVVVSLNGRLAGEDVAFAVVMVDLNDLKRINDTYGHEYGDAYLIGACQLMCEIYVHSPVFRIGGDEFVAILQERDYADRDDLFVRLCDRFRAARLDEERQPWDRYSAAVGMSVYTGAPGETVEDVFRRADEAMYRDKQAMKREAREKGGQPAPAGRE